MNVKFQKVDWDGVKGLMYVEFSCDEATVRWYPKWKEVDDILHCAWLTEAGTGQEHWRNYFDIMCSEILLKDLLRRIAKTTPFEGFSTLDVDLSEIFRRLRRITTKEEQHAQT